MPGQVWWKNTMLIHALFMLVHACPGMAAPWLVSVRMRTMLFLLSCPSIQVAMAWRQIIRARSDLPLGRQAKLICPSFDPPGYLQAGNPRHGPKKRRTPIHQFLNCAITSPHTQQETPGQVTGLTCSPLLDRCLTRRFCTPLICDNALR